MTNEKNYIDNELISLSTFPERLNISHTRPLASALESESFFDITGARKRRQEP
jgi:hypothetical protein